MARRYRNNRKAPRRNMPASTARGATADNAQAMADAARANASYQRNGHKITVFRFDSGWDAYKAARDHAGGEYMEQAGAWSGPEGATLERLALHGDIPTANRARATLDRIIATLRRPTPVKESAVAGGTVYVGDFLTGRPDCFRRRVVESSPRGPLTLYVDICASAGVDRDDMIARGVALLALAAVLAQTRHVKLYAVAGLGPHCRASGESGTAIMQWPVSVATSDLASAAYSLACPAALRRVAFTACNMAGYRSAGSIAWAFQGKPSDSDYGHRMLAALNAEPGSVYIGGAWLHDEAMKRDPVAWVNARVAELNGGAL